MGGLDHDSGAATWSKQPADLAPADMGAADAITLGVLWLLHGPVNGMRLFGGVRKKGGRPATGLYPPGAEHNALGFVGMHGTEQPTRGS